MEICFSSIYLRFGVGECYKVEGPLNKSSSDAEGPLLPMQEGCVRHLGVNAKLPAGGWFIV